MSDAAVKTRRPRSVEKPIVPESRETDSRSERRELSLDVREQAVVLRLEELLRKEFENKPNAPEFAKINVNESAEKQRVLLEQLAGTAMFELIPHLLFQQIPLEQIRSGAVFGQPLDLDTLLRVGNPQGQEDLRQSFEKLRKIFASKNKDPNSVHTIWMQEWKQMVTIAEQGYTQYGKHLLETLSPVTGTATDKTKKEEKGFWEDKWEWAKENPKAATAIGVGLAIGVSYAIWSWFPKKEEKKEDKSKEKQASEGTGFFGKIFMGLTVLGLATAAGIGLGKLSNTETVRGWLRQMGWDDAWWVVGPRRFSDGKFWDLVWHGKFEEAKDFLFAETEKEKQYKLIAEKISSEVDGTISPTTIAKIYDHRYLDDFPDSFIDSLTKSGKDSLASGVRSLLKLTPLIGTLTSAVMDDPDMDHDLPYIASFLSSRREAIEARGFNRSEKVSVGYVLTTLCGVKPSASSDKTTSVIPPAPPAAPPSTKQAETAVRRHTQEKAALQASGQRVLAQLATSNDLDPKALEQLRQDVAGYRKLLDTIDASYLSYLKQNLQNVKAILGMNPDATVTDADLERLYKDILVEHGIILEDLRQQALELEGKLQTLPHPLPKEQRQALQEELQQFYGNYQNLQDNLQRFTVERLNKAPTGPKTTDEKTLQVGQALIYTFWGAMWSVFIKRQRNNDAVTTLAWVQLAGGLVGGVQAVRGGGGALRVGAEFFKGSATTPLYISYKGWEQINYHFRQTSVLARVQSGAMNVNDGIAMLDHYVEKYHMRYDPSISPELKKLPGRRGFFRRIGDPMHFFRGMFNQEQIDVLQNEFRELYKIKTMVDARIASMGKAPVYTSDDLGLDTNRSLLDPYREFLRGTNYDVNDLARRILEKWGEGDKCDYFDASCPDHVSQMAKAKRYAAEIIAEKLGIELAEVEKLTNAKIRVARLKQLARSMREFVGKLKPEALAASLRGRITAMVNTLRRYSEAFAELGDVGTRFVSRTAGRTAGAASGGNTAPEPSPGTTPEPATPEAPVFGPQTLEAQFEALVREGKITPEVVRQLQGMHLTPDVMGKVVQQLQGATPAEAEAVTAVLGKAETYAKYQKVVSDFTKYGTIVFVCVTVHGFEKAEDKIGFLTKTSMEAGGFALAATAVHKTDALLGNKLGNPLVRAGVDLLVGTLAAMGGAQLYDRWIGKWLDTYCPNRNQSTGKWQEVSAGLDTLGIVLLGGAINSTDFALEVARVKGTVDEDTDPLVYLGKTISLVSDGDRGTVTSYMVRDMNRLREEAIKTRGLREMELAKLKKDLAAGKAKGTREFGKGDSYVMIDVDYTAEWQSRIRKLETESIPKLQSFIDGTWLPQKKAEVQVQLATLIQPQAEFTRMAQQIDPQLGGKFMNDLLVRIDNRLALVQNTAEEALWKTLITRSIPHMTFRDFLAAHKVLTVQEKQLDDIETIGNIGGARLAA